MKLRIEKGVYGGAGLGRVPQDASRLAGKTVFVAHTLPGELIQCDITDDRKSFAHARLTNILEPSPQRVVPICNYFPTCGGCQYQHASYPAQLEMKNHILQETLARAGVPIPVSETVSGEPWQYRNRIRLHIRFGDWALCYREAASHCNVPVDHCPIAAAILQQALKLFPRAAQDSGLQTGLFDEIEFFTNEKQDALLLSLWTSSGSAATQSFPILCEALEEKEIPILGALLFQMDTQKGHGRQQAAWGKPELHYTVGSNKYRVTSGSFFQVNRFVLPDMLSRVTAGKHGRLAWDLFAGAGLFALPLSQTFDRIVAVESSASSGRDLIYNLGHNTDERKYRVVSSDTLQFLRKHSHINNAEVPDLVVVDPPRAGLGTHVTALLSRIGPREITYVSCDPSTLARDAQQLLHSGYQLKKITLVDLFPETYHLETIAEFTRI